MIKPELFQKHCNKCFKETPHFIVGITRKRGVRLRCAKCGYVKDRYCKLNTLKKEEINNG